MQTLLDITPTDHTRRQCLMHAVVRNVAQRLKKYAPPELEWHSIITGYALQYLITAG